jgi:hypothetical protein
MCRECDDYPQPVPIVEEALAEIIGLNGDLRKLRAETEAAGERRKQEYASHVFSLTERLASKDRQIAELRERVVKLTPPLVPRHVAEEMGLRGPDEKAEARELASEDRSRERRAAEFDGLLAGAQQLREGMATASGLVAEREPGQK